MYMTANIMVGLVSSEVNDHSNALIVETVRNLKDKGYFVASAHRGEGSSDMTRYLEKQVDFFSRFNPINEKSLLKRAHKTIKGVGDQIKTLAAYSLEYCKPDVFVYSEGDKTNMADLVDVLVDPIITGTADITVASRTKESFKKYPWPQKFFERRFNRAASRELGFEEDVDFVYGPKAYGNGLEGNLLEDFHSDFGTLIYGIARGVADSKMVQAVEVDGSPAADYLDKYGGNFDGVLGTARHVYWRRMQNKGNFRGLKEGLADGQLI